MYLTKKDIQQTERILRLNIINSVTGIKPANLIGTKSNDGFANVGIFSSVVHLGSDPAVLGFVLRPQYEKPRDTYLNIKENGFYTINQVPIKLAKKAHWTSVKFKKEESEFDECKLTASYLHGFHAPFVDECLLKIGLQLKEEVPINSNQTLLMVGEIVHLSIPDEVVSASGRIDLESMGSAGISGLDTYYSLKKESQFEYARKSNLPKF